MQALKLIHQHNLPLPYQLGEELGHGLDGQVFEVLDDPTKVIKLCVLYDETRDLPIEQVYSQRGQILSHLLCCSPPVYASVYEYAKLGEGKRTLFSGQEQQYILYYYVMERLKKLSEDEKKVFHSILSHEDRGAVKDLSHQRVKDILQGLEVGLEFSKEQVISFCYQLASSKVRHLDLHPRNIMVDDLGKFKLVDFDRATL